MKFYARAPAKAILLGEHFVVHGSKALVCAVSLYAYARVSLKPGKFVVLRARDTGEEASWRIGGELPSRLRPFFRCVAKCVEEADVEKGMKIDLWSEIPPSSGLGSSAALSVACAASVLSALGVEFDPNLVIEASFEAEKEFHARPSGIDNTASTVGGLLVFQRGSYEQLGGYLPNFVIGDTGVRRRTGDLVKKVLRFRERNPLAFKSMLSLASHIVERALFFLKEGDLEALGALFSLNQSLLRSIGVSHPKLEELIEASLKAGALGAKLTGAGGGGCMLALAREVPRVGEAIRKAGGIPYVVSVSEGVKVWSSPS